MSGACHTVTVANVHSSAARTRRRTQLRDVAVARTRVQVREVSMPHDTDIASWRVRPAVASNGSSGDGAAASTASPAAAAAAAAANGVDAHAAGAPADGILLELDDTAAVQSAAPAGAKQPTSAVVGVSDAVDESTPVEVAGSSSLAADANSAATGASSSATDANGGPADASSSSADASSAVPLLAPGERAPVVRERLATVISRNFGEAPECHAARGTLAGPQEECADRRGRLCLRTAAAGRRLLVGRVLVRLVVRSTRP